MAVWWREKLTGPALAVVLTATPGCSDGSEDIDAIRAKGELIVLTRNAPTTYYEGREGLMGPEHDMVAAFAAHLGVKPKFLVLDTVAEILQAVADGRGHLAAAGLTITDERKKNFLFAPPYKTIRQELVCHRDGLKPDSVDDLVGIDIAVIADSSYQETLKSLSQDLPGLTWNAETDVVTEELLQSVAEEDLDCTIADSNIVAINQRYHPELVVALPMSKDQELAWVVPERGKALIPELEKWFAAAKTDGRLAEIDNRYYGYVEVFDYVDSQTLHRRIDKRLPRYRPIFEKAADKTGLSWDFLAAVSYQESQWDPKAKSPNGVRGIMMLTQRTASELGVKNRLDPAQSIRGGAKYLKRLFDRLPETITGDDRIWIGLAAYNVGLGHIWDARKLAKSLNYDPDTWAGLRKVLPLLAKKRYYRNLKHGYARGNEPVRLVRRVRNYQDVIRQLIELSADARSTVGR